ncbi:apolipoprotein L1 isoform X2 [Scleropages formosus]|uniref:Apolipoprotein L, 1 n=1 Tax=Scleropages formosus TaxID=113540 RepID=A0A8C9SX16_SCLFO|nr:apolipoprotein L6-like isoform X2 [Scleropages formosus]
MNWLRGSKGDKLTKSLDHKDNYTASSDSSAGENTSSRTTDPKQQKCPADNLVKHGDVSVGDERNTDQERKEISKDFGPEQKKGKKARNPFLPRREHLSKPGQQETENRPTCSHSEQAVMSERNDETEVSQVKDEIKEHEHQEPEEDIDGLLEWWNTVEHWEDVPVHADLSEKEEAKSFVVTAEKVRKGIRVFNKLFNEEAEGLWQHIMDLYAIADGIDRVNKKAKIASITGGSTSAVGGVATIAGLALAPVTMGTSLIVTAVGLGVTTAGGLTSASAGISNTISNSLDRKKVEQIVEDYQAKISNISKCLKFIKQGIENLGKYNVVKMKKRGYNQDFPELNSIYDDSAMAGKAIVCNAAEIMRVVHISSVAGSTAARAVQIASMASGVVTGLFVGMDIYFVAKDSHELRKGAKSEFAAKIREVADQLHSGLVELNSIRQELQEARI